MKTLPPGYKRGSHGFIFRWNGFEYVRANLDPAYRHKSAKINVIIKMGRKREPIIDGKKLCKGKNGCGQMKPVSDFYINKGYYMSICKKCDRKRNSEFKKQARRLAA